jgi:hypothetical protein
MTDQQDVPTAPEYVWVFGLPGGDDDEDDSGDRLSFFGKDAARVGRQPVPVSRLRENMSTFVAAMETTIAAVPTAFTGYAIDSVEISAEVSATGTVSLLGSGGEIAGTAGITFTLKRRES